MNCLECQDLLQRRLDGESIDTPALERHLHDCSACREQHAGAIRLLEGLRELPRPSLPTGFAKALAGEVIRDRRRRRDHLRRRVYLTVALAASVMAILLVGYNWLPRTQPVRNFNFVKVQPKQDVPPSPKTPDEPRDPLTPVIDRLAETTRDHARVVQVAMSLDDVDRLPAVSALPPLDPGVREASQEVSDSVRTVTRSARKAFNFFARELPMPDMGELKN